MRLRNAILASILLSFVASSSFAENACENLFSNSQKLSSSKVRPQDEDSNAEKVSAYFTKEFLKQSDKLKATITNKTITLDFLCVGAGPQCATASLVLAGSSTIKALVVEKSDLIAKTFAEKDFLINSTEEVGLTMHAIPGGIGSLAQYTSHTYARSLQLAAHIQAQQYVSNIPVLLQTKIIGIKIVKILGSQMVEVKTDNGITIITKYLAFATGLGEVGTKVKDPNYKAEFRKIYEQHLITPDIPLPVMTVDTLLKGIKNAKSKGKPFAVPQEIIVIGNGDGARIAIEGLSDLGVHFHITWIGNNSKTAEEYIASQQGWDRYLPKITPLYRSGKITGLEGRVEKVDFLKGMIRVTATDPATKKSFTSNGQMIVDATGYEPSNASLLETAGIVPKTIDILGSLAELGLVSTTLARQYIGEREQALPIYALGPSAGMLAKPEEMIDSPNGNPVAIFNTAPRTSNFVADLFQLPRFESRRGIREGRPMVLTAKELIRQAQDRRDQVTRNRPELKL